MKKIFLLVALGFVSLFATGCFANSSASSVAKDLVKRLSNGNYKNIDRIIYSEDRTLISEDNFKSLIDKYDLNIKGNNVIEVVEESEITTNEDGYNVASVTVLIDNEENLVIDTIEVDGSWYVYNKNFYDTDVNIIVPKGVKLEINGRRVLDSKIEKKVSDFNIIHPGVSELKYYDPASLTVNIEDAEVDVYVLKNPMKGSYEVKLKGDNEVKDVIMTYSSCEMIESDNYEHKCVENEGVYYDFRTVNMLDNTDIRNFVKNYLVSTHKALDENKDFSSIENFYIEDIKEVTKENYNNVKALLQDATTEVSSPLEKAYYSDYDVTALDFIDIEVLDDTEIVVVYNYTLDYDCNIVHSANNVEVKDYLTEYKAVMHLTKSGDTYKIKNGFGLFVQ